MTVTCMSTGAEESNPAFQAGHAVRFPSHLSHRIANQRVSAPGGEGMTCILTLQGACLSDWLGNLGSRWHKAVRDVKNNSRARDRI